MKSKFFILILVFVFTNPNVLISQDTADGIIWYPAIQLSDSTHNAHQPRIALSGKDTVHVTWSEDAPRVRLPYIRSTQKNIFETIRELLPDTVAYPDFAHHSFVLANRQKVYVFFTTGSLSPARMRNSVDAGETFSDVIDLSSDLIPRIFYAAINGDTIALHHPRSVADRAILRTTDEGQTWTRTRQDFEEFTHFALTTGKLHLVRGDSIYQGAAEVYYQRSSNIGDSWEYSDFLSTVDGLYSDLPTIAGFTSECGTEILTAWRDVKYGWFGCCGASIIIRVSIDNGKNWLPENNLTLKPDGTEPQVAINENVRAIGWWREIVPDDTFHVSVRGSNNPLIFYTPIYDLTPNSYTISPTLTVSSNAIHFVWSEKKGSTFRIFYRRGEFVPSNAEFSLSTSFLEIDTTESGQSSTDTVLVFNTGIDPLIIGTTISNNENFTVMPESVTVASLNSYPFVINFTPKLFGNHEGKIIFYHNGQSSPDCFDVRGFCVWAKDTVAEYRKGKWNMVSTSMKYGVNNKMPDLFFYDSCYIRADSMEWGKGYWAKPIDTSFVYTGAPVTNDSIIVKTGWNLIGSLTKPVLTSAGITTVPDSIIESLFYHFNGSGYVDADTIKPGKSYWIKVKQDGKINMKANSE